LFITRTTTIASSFDILIRTRITIAVLIVAALHARVSHAFAKFAHPLAHLLAHGVDFFLIKATVTISIERLQHSLA
jgi:hypothetical protein